MTREDLILQRIEDLHEEVKAVKKLATATNGRLRKVEEWRARMEGLMLAFRTIPTFAALIAGVAGVGSFVLMLTH